MNDVSDFTLTALKRKAKKLKKGLYEKDPKALEFIKNHHPRRSKKMSHSDIHHAIAKSKGYNSWDLLRQARLEYARTFIKNPTRSADEIYIHEHFRAVKTLNRIFTPEVLSKLPDYIISDIERLKQYISAFIDLEDEEKSDFYDFCFSRNEIAPEKILISFYYFEIIKGKEALLKLQDEIRHFHAEISASSKKVSMEEFLKTESNVEIKEFIQFFIKQRNQPIQMKECPDCFSPNPPDAIECTGCGYSFY